jgi:alpha-glucosidase
MAGDQMKGLEMTTDSRSDTNEGAVTGFAWWQAGVIYQVYPRSFADANGDGVGDLPGITTHLDHLQRLGVDAVWLSPIYPSPMIDFGYDVTDHTSVHPLFGDLADFDALVAAAHRRRLRVLLDFIPNHTSDQHPWFTAARSARTNTYRAWYLWADPAPDGGPPTNWRSVFGGPAWTLDKATGQYYYHAYLPQQPDLNWRNPAVRDAQFDVMRTWLDRGVHGFRIDAFRHLIKDAQLRDNPVNPTWRPGMPPYEKLVPQHTTDQPEVHDIVAAMRAVLNTHPAPSGSCPPNERIMIGELYLPLEPLMRYYGQRSAGMHQPSNMHLIGIPWRAPDIAKFIDAYEAALPEGAWPNWVLGNHDRSRIASRLGPAQARIAAMLLLTLRGTPTLYYGDELGLADVPIPPELVQDPYEKQVPGIGVGRDPQRTPFPWSAGPNAGFCPRNATPWLPLTADVGTLSVEAQSGRDESMLSLYQRLLALRRAEPALAVGSYTPVPTRGDLLVYLRQHQEHRVLIALNLSHQPVTVPLPDTAREGRRTLSTHPQQADQRNAVTGTELTLASDEGVILTLT